MKTSTLARLGLAPLVLTLVTSVSLAQTPLHLQHSQVPGEQNNFGLESATGLGDVDGDGVPDYAVGARMTADLPGYVGVYSGATGDSITTLHGNGGVDAFGQSDRFGWSIAGLGDVNGDSVPDVLVGAPYDDTFGLDDGVAQVVSGSDWTVLREHSIGAGLFGLAVAAVGDGNGDGVSEYVVARSSSWIHAFDGATGALLWTFQATSDNVGNLSPVPGDGDGDGLADVLVGAQAGHPGSSGPPYVLVLDAITGGEKLRIDGPNGSNFGASLSWIGDVNGDARDDIAVCRPGGPPDLQVFDGFTGAKLYELTGDIDLDRYVCGVGDQDGDGLGDFAVADGGVPELYSGAAGTFLHAFDATPPAPEPGTSWLAPVGDLDGDGKQELLSGMFASGSGVAVVFQSDRYLFEDLGFALGGSLAPNPKMEAEGSLLAGSVLDLSLSGGPPNAPAFIAIGFQALYLPLFGGTFVPYPNTSLKKLGTDVGGAHQVTLTLPAGIPGGVELYLQYWIFGGGGPEGLVASNAVRSVFP